MHPTATHCCNGTKRRYKHRCGPSWSSTSVARHDKSNRLRQKSCVVSYTVPAGRGVMVLVSGWFRYARDLPLALHPRILMMVVATNTVDSPITAKRCRGWYDLGPGIERLGSSHPVHGVQARSATPQMVARSDDLGTLTRHEHQCCAGQEAGVRTCAVVRARLAIGAYAARCHAGQCRKAHRRGAALAPGASVQASAPGSGHIAGRAVDALVAGAKHR